MTRLKDKETDASNCDTACGQLCGGAWFFAMHSCEYSKVYGDQRTKLLCLENLQFIRDKKELPLNHPELHLVLCQLPADPLPLVLSVPVASGPLPPVMVAVASSRVRGWCLFHCRSVGTLSFSLSW
jgi:hypothetical protein